MNPRTLLLVEDDENDIFFARRAVKPVLTNCQLQVASTGLEALDYLQGNGDFNDREKYPLPSILFLDLKLPLKTGFEVLEWIRSQLDFDTMPIVIFTSSREAGDIRKAYQLGANSYLVKPHQLEIFEQRFLDAINYWCLHNTCL